jgi:expansin (peptidoglycan-binding protein)
MLSLDITLAGDASSSQIYSLVDVDNGNSVRKNSSAPADAPQSLTIKHESYTKSGYSGGRHLIRLDRSRAQATTLIPVQGSVYVVIDAPANTVSAADLKDMFTQLKNLLTAGVISQMLNGEP